MSSWYKAKDGTWYSPEARRISSAKTRAAIARGEIPPPKRCNRCGQSAGIVQYHNHDYSDPVRHLEPLCWRCHMMLHSAHFAPQQVDDYFASVAKGQRWPPILTPDFQILSADHAVARPPRRTLRIAVWNCAQSLHKKFDYFIQMLEPDVAVIPECANPDMLKKRGIPLTDGSYAWIGENRNKGLGIFTFGDYRIVNSTSAEQKWILPVNIAGPIEFDLIAVWARYHEAKRTGAPGPVLDYIDALASTPPRKPTIMAGDFNSSVKFKRSRRHQNIVQGLEALGLQSAYHRYYFCEQGVEPHPTIFWRDRSETGPQFHIDYCFIPKAWCKSLKHLSVGTFGEWVAKIGGDHVPLLVELDLRELNEPQLQAR